MLRFLVLALLVACAADDDPLRARPPADSPARIAFDLGLTEHLGRAEPVETTERNGATTYTFDPADGPVCMRGAPFRTSLRDEPGEDLLIFLQGGGACWSEFCLAVTTAPAGIPDVNVLDQTLPENPFADFDVVYVPYCDGSLFAGSNDLDDDGDGVPERLHHGLENVSAALTMAHRHFPTPRRVVLAGSSGGGFGTILASFLVRYVYPDVPLLVINDAGIGVARGNDPSFVDGLLDEFNARRFVPADCPECVGNGHITGFVRYFLDRDPNVRVAAISAWDDFVMGDLFLKLEPAEFRDALRTQSDALHDAHPDRYRRFFFAGRAHTALLGDPTGIVGRDLGSVELPPEALESLAELSLESLPTAHVGDARLETWLRALLADDLSGWTEVLEDPGPLPTSED
ncbi:MAG: vtpJ-therm [Sandaracinus sp.]|nr:vtpJ-therm [Sandaracinus sp.]MCB9619227.1 vtpJ-therm [Sandaracinus sp.]